MNGTFSFLAAAKRLQAIAQTGLSFSKDPYDLQRYEEIRRMSFEMFEAISDTDISIIANLFRKESGYPTPKVDVRASVFKDGKILMIQETEDGMWAIPGGWADQDVSVREMVTKECCEEAGVEVEPERIVAIFDRNKYNTPILPMGCYKIFVQCKLIGGSFEKNIETSNAGFFALDELPSLSLTRNTFEQIKVCFDAAKEKCWQAVFD